MELRSKCIVQAATDSHKDCSPVLESIGWGGYTIPHSEKEKAYYDRLYEDLDGLFGYLRNNCLLIFMKECRGKYPLGRSKRRWQDNVKWDLKEL
jgi:hypothetical protein